MEGIERSLTDAALADRLRRIVARSRSWPREQRDALIREAARRLEANSGEASDES